LALGGCASALAALALAALALAAGTAGATGRTSAPLSVGPTSAAGESACTSGSGTPSYSAATPYWLSRVSMDGAWAISQGAGVTVAVVDSGVERTTPQLAGAVRSGADLLGGGTEGTKDTFGHGTMVAGVIAARRRAGSGVIGIAPAASIYPILQTAGDKPDQRSNLTTLASAIRLATAAKADVINISEAARPDPNDPNQRAPLADLREAIDDAYQHNIVVVAAAGNWNNGVDPTTKQANTNPVTYPASMPHVLAVGAVDQYDAPAPFSERGGYVDVAAPGVDVTSTWPGGGDCEASGTSFAAPYVAGVAALIRAHWPNLTADQVIADIERTADDTGDHQRDDATGFGIADPVRALTAPDFSPQDATGRQAAAPAESAHVYLGKDTATQARDRHSAALAVGLGALLVAIVVTTATVSRAAGRRRTLPPTHVQS
jgi:type VII secretion-associated serine protease mycosin